jgi:SPFH domain / Band 7 family
MITKNFRLLAVIWSLILMSGCDTGIHKVEPSEYGIKFRKLPVLLGGGVSSSVVPPGELVIAFPWDSLYTFTTAVQEVSWGPGKKFDEYLNTRARDGNEVALAMTVRYQLSTRTDDLIRLVQSVATDDKGIEDLVVQVAGADIRYFMNELRTAEFIDPTARAQAIERIRKAMQDRLSRYFINVVMVTLDDFRFERALPDGTKDDTYQEKLDEIQKVNQETEREQSRIATIVASKQRAFNDEQARVNRVLEEAKGVKLQAEIRGENYLLARRNEAEAILTNGRREVEGVQAKIESLSGPGGRAILTLDVARGLREAKSKFFVVQEGNESNGVSVRKLDANKLIEQIGLIESMNDASSEPARKSKREVTQDESEVRTGEQKN